MRRVLLTTALAALLLLGAAPRHPAADKKDPPPDPVPKEVRALQGTYKGSWTLFGVDAKGKAVPRMSWTDTLKAGDPQVKDGRAYVTTTGEMAFEGGKPPPVKITGKEGYYLKKGGGLADYFMETAGGAHRMVKVGDGVWSYAAAASAVELAQLGFPKGATGRHVLVKVVAQEGGVETHRITRVTTATWKDKDGKEHGTQYTSLQGWHKRQP